MIPGPTQVYTQVYTRPLTWLEHAERHFNTGVFLFDPSIVHYSDEILMYLCIMAHEGMFD